MSELVDSVRQIIEKSSNSSDAVPRFKVFFASGLNMNDIRTTISNLNETERGAVLALYNQVFEDSILDILSAPCEERLVALFGALYSTSSNTSHIANAYAGEGSEHGVWAILHDRVVKEGDFKITVTGSSKEPNLTVQLPETVRREINQVPRHSYWAKNRKDGIYGDKSRNSFSAIEYLTLISVEKNGSSSRVLVRNFPVLANYSFILNGKGELKRQKYGEHDKFLDVDGFNHRE